MSKSLIMRPRLSEKTYGLSESRVYVVEVPTTANKHTVARAIESQFDVTVTKVNVMNVKGKSKRTMSLSGKRYANSYGNRNDIKKAYVTLAKGQGLPFFEAIEEEEQKQENIQQQVDKAAAKQAAKDDKQAAKDEKKATKKAPKPEKVEAESKPVEDKPRRRLFLRGRKGKGDQ